MRRSTLVLTMAACIATVATAADAATIYVSPCGDDTWTGASAACNAPDGPKRTIGAAIMAAETDGDEIVVQDGTYSGAGNKNLGVVSFSSPDIVIRSANGPGVTIIDLEDDGRFLDYALNISNANVLDGFTIRKGRAPDGAGVRCRFNAAPIIRNCRFIDCVAFGGLTPSDGGGAIKLTSSPATIESCDFSGNLAFVTGGGAVLCETGSDATFTDCTFEGNASLDADDGFGGALSAIGSSITVTDCTFTANECAFAGGGLASLGGVATTIVGCVFEENHGAIAGGAAMDTGVISRSRFSRNTTEPGFAAGAGMFLFGSGGTFPAPIVDSCIFDENESSFGAALTMQGPALDAEIVNCLFVFNHAVDSGFGGVGGAFIVADADPNVTNCTFYGNTADTAGGACGAALSSNPQFAGCVMWGNSAPAGSEMALVRLFPEDPPASAGVRYSNVAGGEKGVFLDVDSGLGSSLVWGPGNIEANPRFVNAAAGDWRLRAGSPGIDAADNTAFPGGIFDDLDGNPRFLNDLGMPDVGEGGDNPAGFGIADMGAYEFQDTTPPCPDLDGSGGVGIGDLLRILAAWGPCGGCIEDVDGDGTVGMLDLCFVLAEWGSCE